MPGIKIPAPRTPGAPPPGCGSEPLGSNESPVAVPAPRKRKGDQ